MTEPRAGRVHQIAVSPGGVPKRPVLLATVTRDGIAGDWQDDRRYHGGPERAVCLLSLEVIERLRGEGNPIAPGSTGENLTLEGVDWSCVAPGARIRFASGVVLEVTSYTTPCSKIAASFTGGDVTRLSVKRTGDSRVYARVLAEGTLHPGETFLLFEAPRETS